MPDVRPLAESREGVERTKEMLDAVTRDKVPFATMTRSFVIAALVGGGLLAASPGCSEEGVGDPCTPEQEYVQTFNGFDPGEVNIESKSFQCRTRVCLVNHFRGRVSCPYGQDSSGSGPDGADGCKVPGTNTAITGNPNDTAKLAKVEPQCTERTADKAVYCSCRCADINGDKPSDQTFCDCPDGFMCAPLVTSIGTGNEGLTGSYCIKQGTQYQDGTCAAGSSNCDATKKDCGEAQ